MIKINKTLSMAKLQPKLRRFWELSGDKIRRIEHDYDESKGAPVFTRQGLYTSRGWTEWTQGFQYGAALIQFDATGESEFLDLGRKKTVERMAPHLTHFGVHDHGFNNVSTYGHLMRLASEGRFEATPWEQNYYELAMKVSGAVQARRWTTIKDGGGYIYSFNGPHSLFADTIRSLRALAVSHKLGHALMGENDQKTSLLDRLIQHARTTAKYVVFYGEGRDAYDVRGRVAHEGIFNLNDGCFRCPNSQQGYSPFSTWTRGLAWILCGYAEQLEFLTTCSDAELKPLGGRKDIEALFLKAACATADFYLENTPSDGIPYWDTGAPGLSRLGNYLSRPADPFNAHEPVDSSAAAIAVQGLLRLGTYLKSCESRVTSRESRVTSHESAVKREKLRLMTLNSRLTTHDSQLTTHDSQLSTLYTRAGLTVLNSLLSEPYLSNQKKHQGLILHSVYHRPNGWDAIPRGQKVPCGESSMWGDYHAREAALYVQRLIDNKPYLTFFKS